MFHPLKVALHFSPLSREFWLALAHDGVEDGYLPAVLLRVWPGLDAITRRPGEVYQTAYIPRVARHPVARRVKMADMEENMKRAPASLMKRYRKAYPILSLTAETAPPAP